MASLKYINQLNRWKDFEILHINKSYYFSSTILGSISPIISNIIENNLPFSFTLPLVDGNINYLYQIINGEEIIISEGNCLFILSLSLSLGIDSLFKGCSDICLRKDIDELVKTILFLIPYQTLLLENFIAINFQLLIKSLEFEKVPPKFLINIILNSNFNPNVSASLFTYLTKLYSNEPDKYLNLLKISCTKFNNPTNLSILMSSKLIDLNLLRDSLIDVIVSNSQIQISSNPTIPINFEIGKEMNGLFDYYRQKNSLNSYVNISSSSQFKPEFSPLKLLELNNVSYFSSFSGPIEWIQIYLPKSSLAISHYVLQSCEAAKNGIAPITWTFEGSFDGKEWKLLDNKEQNNILCSSKKIVSFPIENSWESYSYFKFTQIQNGGKNNKRLVLAGIELFGVLTSK